MKFHRKLREREAKQLKAQRKARAKRKAELAKHRAKYGITTSDDEEEDPLPKPHEGEDVELVAYEHQPSFAYL